MARRAKPPVIIVHVQLHLPLKEALALAEACHRFGFEDARHLLRFARNMKADRLCEAMTQLLRALNAALPLEWKRSRE